MNDDPIAFQINRGIAAQRVLDDELINDVFAALDAEYIAAWKTEHVPAHRELYWSDVRSLINIRSKLQRWVDAGKIAKKQLDTPPN